MFYVDIVKDDWPWKNPGGWKWWSTKEGRKGRKIIRRKFKFYTIHYAYDWLQAKKRDYVWVFLLFPKIIYSGLGITAAVTVAKAAAKASAKMAAAAAAAANAAANATANATAS